MKTNLAVQAAFVGIASRLVGATFRVLESTHPKLQQRHVISDPDVVLKRELITLSLAWLFCLLANIVISPWARKHQWNRTKAGFIIAGTSALITETVGRLLAYRKLDQKPAMLHIPIANSPVPKKRVRSLWWPKSQMATHPVYGKKPYPLTCYPSLPVSNPTAWHYNWPSAHYNPYLSLR